MDMRERKKVINIRKIRSQMHKREKDIGKKCNVTKSLCRDEREYSVNDISNVRCHGWDVGNEKERRITTLFNMMKER